METFFMWLGKFHVAVVVFPIALILAGALAAVLMDVTRREVFRQATRYCVVVGLIGVWVAAPLGLLLEDRIFGEAGGPWILTWHKWLGIAALILSFAVLALYLLRRGGQRKWAQVLFQVTLFALAGLVGAAAFFGGAMLLGIDHYAWP